MGLNLKGTPVVSRRATERNQKALDILEEIQDQVARMGLPVYPKPSSAPKPLADLSVETLSNRELEVHLVAYTSYAMFIAPKLAEAEAAYKISTANLKSVAASLKVSLFKDKTAQKEVEATVQTSPEYIAQELEHLKMFATREILDAHYKAYAKQASVLSRIIELRKLEFEQELRADNVGKYRGGKGPAPRGGMPGRLRT